MAIAAPSVELFRSLKSTTTASLAAPWRFPSFRLSSELAVKSSYCSRRWRGVFVDSSAGAWARTGSWPAAAVRDRGERIEVHSFCDGDDGVNSVGKEVIMFFLL